MNPYPKAPKVPQHWADGYTPVDRERNRLLFREGYAMRGNIQDTVRQRLETLRPSNYYEDSDTYDFGGVRISASMYQTLTQAQLAELIERKRQAMRMQNVYADDFWDRPAPVSVKPGEPELPTGKFVWDEPAKPLSTVVELDIEP